jgi:hypothetical protein
MSSVIVMRLGADILSLLIVVGGCSLFPRVNCGGGICETAAETERPRPSILNSPLFCGSSIVFCGDDALGPCGGGSGAKVGDSASARAAWRRRRRFSLPAGEVAVAREERRSGGAGWYVDSI